MTREVINVMDTSGSMSATSIEQARAALAMGLTRLTPQDRFNVIQFNSNTSQLYAQAVPVNARTLQEAKQYVSYLQAQGARKWPTRSRLR